MGVQLNIKDAETVRLARELAGRSGRTVTDTIRSALMEEARRLDAASSDRMARLEAMIEEVRANLTPDMRLVSSKEVQDSLYDHGIRA